MRSHHQNVERIVTVARQIGDLLPKVVFAGGSATGLLVTDPAFPDLRPTIDVDIIVEVMSLVDYYGLQKSLREKGFCEAPDQGVICLRILQASNAY